MSEVTPDPFEKGRVTFCVSVLWIHGMSLGNIAALSKRTRASVDGIVRRTFTKRRDDMTFEERQLLLDQMKAKRKDDGRLPEKYFTALANPARQPVKKVIMAPAPRPIAQRKPEPPPKPATMTQRKKSRHHERQEELRRERLEAADRAEREAGKATKRGLSGAALEWLHALKILSDPNERSVDAAPKAPDGMLSHDRRREAGVAFRACLDACRVGGMASVDFEREVRGGGAGMSISWWKLMSLDTLGAIRKLLGERDYEMLEAIVDRDEFVWEQIKSTTAKRFMFEAIRRSLDGVALLWRFMSIEEFEKRWGYRPENWNLDGLDDEQAREIATQAREMIKAGLRTA